MGGAIDRLVEKLVGAREISRIADLAGEGFRGMPDGGDLSAAGRTERAADKKKIKELEKELHRKDRALAETTALLVLKKKADLIWGSGENE